MARGSSNMLNYLLLAGGGLLLYNYIQGKGLTERPYIQRLRIYVFKFDVTKTGIYITFKIENPNSDSAKIRSIVGVVFINGNKVGTIDYFKPLDVLGNAESTLTVNVKLDTIGLVANVLQVLLKKTPKQVASFVGTININGQPVPVTQQFNIF